MRSLTSLSLIVESMLKWCSPSMDVKRCLLDLDGVLVDFVRGTCRLHNKMNPYFDGNYQGFYFNEAWQMPASEFWTGMDKKFWANLDWTLYGKLIFNFVHEKFGPENTCILTAPCLTEGCFDGKMSWIREHLPKAYHRQFLVGSAKDFCARADHVLIDDRDENCQDFIKAGGNAVLVPAMWNANRMWRYDPYGFVFNAFNESSLLRSA